MVFIPIHISHIHSRKMYKSTMKISGFIVNAYATFYYTYWLTEVCVCVWPATKNKNHIEENFLINFGNNIKKKINLFDHVFTDTGYRQKQSHFTIDMMWIFFVIFFFVCKNFLFFIETIHWIIQFGIAPLRSLSIELYTNFLYTNRMKHSKCIFQLNIYI